MQIRILGSAAGGGLPQWNCGCANCRAARDGSPHVRPRRQSSVAISVDGKVWFLLNVSADVREQLAAYDDLCPARGMMRGTPIAGCLLTDAELDHTSGLLQLREGSEFSIFSTPLVRRWLRQFLPIESVVTSFSNRPWLEFTLDEPMQLVMPDGQPAGLEVTAFETGRDVPRFVPEEPTSAVGSVVGLKIVDRAGGGQMVYAPGVPAIEEKLRQAVDGADLVLLDGAFWSDDEPKSCGISDSTSRQMGHLPISGEDGSLAWFSSLQARYRVYVHINNTNPILDERSPEYSKVRECGVQVGNDGDEFVI